MKTRRICERIVIREAIPLILIAALSAAPGHAHAGGAGDEPSLAAGEAIYRQGLQGSGEPLVADHEGGARMQGQDAACVNCHRRSGLGAREGNIAVPPVTGRYILASGADEYRDLPYVETMRPYRNPYTEATLARAIREGVGADGKELSYLMPRFSLNDADMKSLIGYLKSLDRETPPGVTDTVLHFATIITPDADPAKRDGMLAVLNQFFADKNAFPLGPTPRMRSTRKEMYMVNRRWQLHIWQLSGPAMTWQAQLERHFTQEPVLAVLSGVGGANWAPVHEFCERRAVPCLFPNVEAPPPGADHYYYSLYFSKGVALEAGLIANRLLDPGGGKTPGIVHQIYRAGDSGEAGALALAASLERRGISVRSQILSPGSLGKGVEKALRLASKADAVVLWLRPPDIAALGRASAALPPVFMSGLLGALVHGPLPSDWRAHVRLAYPFALQAERRASVDYAFGWFAMRHVFVVSEQVQADTFLACSLLAETLKHMVDTFVPDYLVERIEDMTDQRVVTGYYPHLTLGPSQRFASKGGYIVRFSGADGAQLAADGSWIVP